MSPAALATSHPHRMSSQAELRQASVRRRVPRRIPATGLPVARENRRGWSALSLLLHVLLIALLTMDLANHEGVVTEVPQGAGGLGPAGGGGGGKHGTGGVKERVSYVQVQPPTPA